MPLPHDTNYQHYDFVFSKQREALKDALLRYCELDTMAMIMLLEEMMRLENNTAL